MTEKSIKDLKFEEALERLEKIVEKLESGGLTLDQAIKAFEEGTKLRKFCEEKLKETERKVEQIIEKENGTYSVEPFNREDLDSKDS